MGEVTKIEWVDHSWSPWIGCTKLTAACDNCYAADMAKRRGWAIFETGAPRHRTSASYWKQPIKWNAKAEAAGKRESVFPSLCDPFDAEVSDDWRAEWMGIVEKTPHLLWLPLTKRPKVARQWFDGRKVPDNLWPGTTAEDQKMLDLRGPDILAIKAKVHFLSYEPALGGIDAYHGAVDPRLGGVKAKQSLLGHWWEPGAPRYHPGHWGFTWVIAGGESGPKARPSHPEWFRSIRDQCIAADVPFFFKQWGEWRGFAPTEEKPQGKWHDWNAGHVSVRVGKKNAGAVLDGREWREMPS
jgi:protein gp37